MRKIFGYIFLCVFVACQQSVTKTGLETGLWKGQLVREDGVIIPFLFDVKEKNGHTYLEVINAGERLKVDELSFSGDSLKIVMPLFDSEFIAGKDGDGLRGWWIKHLADKDVKMEFIAIPEKGDRFPSSEDAIANITGRWDVTFSDSSKAIGEFEQHNDRKVTGTFLTTTGDYRFLEGVVNGDSLYLSCFDGSHAYLFTAKMENGELISGGKFYSGRSSKDEWNAVKNENAKLPDADSLTFLKDGYDRIDFTFPDVNGKKVSLSDPRFKNKVVVVQIMGSWCPNCMDETEYLAPYYNTKHAEGFEVIGLAYERSSDFTKASKNVKRVIDKFDVQYEVLIAGTTEKGQVNASLPMLKNFLGYPTTIFIDKSGKVRRIHTGFSGPATGKHFTEFKKEFEAYIDQLIKE